MDNTIIVALIGLAGSGLGAFGGVMASARLTQYRLKKLEENLADATALGEISHGWPAILANLKSLLETGDVLPQAPWEMHAELRDAQMAKNG